MRFSIETGFCAGLNSIIRVEGHPAIVVAGVAAYLRALERRSRAAGPLRVHRADGSFVKDNYDTDDEECLLSLPVGGEVSLDVSPDGASQSSTVWAKRCLDEEDEAWAALVEDPDRTDDRTDEDWL